VLKRSFLKKLRQESSCAMNSSSGGLCCILAAICAATVCGTSIKMDFLPLGDVRIDPVISPGCLSDHVHTFYGASVISATTTYDDLRAAQGNSGNVEENPSLYWHPTVYKVEPSTGIRTKVPIWFASAYYVWETGIAKAWPNAFKMIAYSSTEPPEDDGEREFVGTGPFGKSGTKFVCADPQTCERADCSTTSQYFPAEACAELEVSFQMASCWDGVSTDSENHMDHVAYTSDGAFDSECPSSHPVKIPQIHLYFRVRNYEGGHHEFSDGTGVYHADYMSGWNQTFLQHLLDDCQNPSETASPDAFCENILTYRGSTKVTGQAHEDDDISDKLQNIQPTLDVSAITTESIDNINELPMGHCTGTLLANEATVIDSGPVVTRPGENSGGNSPGEGDDDNDDDADDDDDDSGNTSGIHLGALKWQAFACTLIGLLLTAFENSPYGREP